jgi:hypothetical protein
MGMAESRREWRGVRITLGVVSVAVMGCVAGSYLMP